MRLEDLKVAGISAVYEVHPCHRSAWKHGYHDYGKGLARESPYFPHFRGGYTLAWGAGWDTAEAFARAKRGVNNDQ